MDKRLKELLEWLQRNQSGNPYAKETPFHPWGKKGIKPIPFPEWPEADPNGVKPVPMPNMFDDLPEYDPESEWYNPNWREEREKNLPEGHLLHLIPPSQAERYKKRFNLGGMMKPKWTPEQGGGTLKNPKWTPGQGGGTLKNVGEDPTLPIRIKPNDLGFGGRVSNLPERVEPTPAPDFWKKRTPYFPRGGGDWEQLLNKAQVGSAMYGRGTPSYYPGNRRENMMIPPPMRKRYPAELDPATGQNRVVPGTLKTSYPNEERMRGPQLGGVPESDRKFVDSMHAIQSAYFTGADFGYEEEWGERLGVPEEQIAMFMAVPEEAIKHAMNNPTDAVLEQFEEYYGFPLNVNDPDMQEYFERVDRGVGSKGKWNASHLDGQMLGELKQDSDGYYAIMDPEGESRFGGFNLTDEQQRNGVRIEIPASMINNKGFGLGEYVPDDDYTVVNGVLGYKKRKR